MNFFFLVVVIGSIYHWHLGRKHISHINNNRNDSDSRSNNSNNSRSSSNAVLAARQSDVGLRIGHILNVRVLLEFMNDDVLQI